MSGSDPIAPPSRRALLVAALGAGTAAIAGALDRPRAAAAADGNAVVVGGEYLATSVTKFDTQATGAQAIWGKSDSGYAVRGTSTSSYGVYGTSMSGAGVYGTSESDQGVFGSSSTGWAIYGVSISSIGVAGTSSAADGFASGVYGNNGRTDGTTRGVLGRVQSPDGVAIQGYSAPSSPLPAPSPKTGIHGVADHDGDAIGVHGSSPLGSGIVGFSGTGNPVRRARTGVLGQANQGTSGVGVRGHSGGGTGIYATTTTGTALRADGRVRFDKCAGVATAAEGANSIAVTPGVDIVATSAIVATVLSNSTTTVMVRRVSVDLNADSFTVHLTGTAPAGGLKVSWIVLG